jgi:DNA-binding NarL/FixJ family response regulator
MSANTPWPAVVLDRSDDAVAVVDTHDQIVYANRTAREQLFGLGITGASLIGPEAAALAREVRAAARPRRNVVLEAPSGSPWRGRALPLENGAVAFVLRRAADRAERAQAVKEAMGLNDNDAQLAIYTADGMSNREIADLYRIPVGTVATRLWRLYRKVGVSNRAELAAVVGAVGRGDGVGPS